jgi:A118 family predicted phage portal protein
MPDSEEYKETLFYRIVNKAFISNTETSLGVEVDLASTKWSNLQPITDIVKKNNEKLNGMLFGYFKMPLANLIDMGSPLGMSLFGNAMEELKDLDIAYSRNSTEIRDSKRIVMVDDRLTDIPSIDSNGKRIRTRIKLPAFVKNIFSDDPTKFYQEVNPALNTSVRKEGIDNQLSLIGCKCGYSNGYFVLDQKTGMITATQVEADDRRTIQTIKDIRDKLKICINELLYAESVFMDLYKLAPVGDYEANYNFGDITYNYAEDKDNWWKYVQSGKIPAWKYFLTFEGMSEDEAKELAEEMRQEDNLFSAE